MTSGELMARLGRKAEGVNLLEIEKYLRESKVRHQRLCSLWRTVGMLKICIDRAKDLWILGEGAGEGCGTRCVWGIRMCLRTKLTVFGVDTIKLAKLARLANTTPPLHAVESFIVALTASSDGEYSASDN